MGADTPEVHVGTIEDGLFIGLNGRATQRVCPTINRLVEAYLTSPPTAVSVTLDLSGCNWVDSTFAGWLVAVQRRLAKHPGARLLLAHASERCRASLDRLNIEHRFEFNFTPPPANARPIPCTSSDRPSRPDMELMLRAHEELAAVNEQNGRVFGPVVELLKRQLQTA